MRCRPLSLALSLFVPLAMACGGDPEARVSTAIPVTTTIVVAVDLEERIDSTGQIIAQNHATIASEVGGRISAITIDEGRHAETDAVIVEIDPERRKLEFATAKARLAEAEAGLREHAREAKRVRKLFASNVASQAKLDQSKTQLELGRSRVDAAEARLGVAERSMRDAEVRAPFAGLVADRRVNVGQFVQPGTPLFDLVSLDPIQVEFHIAEIDSGRIEMDQLVSVRVAPYPDDVFRARVTVISPTINERTRTLRVKANLENPEGRLRPGTFAQVDLGVALRKDVLRVEEEAVLQRGDGAVVFRLGSDNRVERLVVETGVRHEGTVEIRGEISVGDSIVARGHASLIDGAVVVVRNRDGSSLVPPIASGPNAATSVTE